MTEKEMIFKAFERTGAEITPIEGVYNYYEIRPKNSFETIGLTFDSEDKLIDTVI